jgi:hypothetical protein
MLEQVAVQVEESGSSELQPMYDKIENALAGAIGPIAGMVIQDYINKWKAAGPEVPARLSELAAMLTREIGDPELEKQFTASVEKIM